MIFGLLCMAVANAGVVLAARATLRRVSTGRPAADLVLFFLLRFAFVMGLVIAAGLTKTLSAAGLGLAGGAILAVLWWKGERFDLGLRTSIPPDVPRLALGIAVFLGVRSLLQAWIYTPTDGDVTSYHLPKVGEWIRAGSFYIEMGHDPRAWFPAGFELVEAWWAVFLHHDVLIELAGLEFLVLACSATWALADWLGLGPRAASLAALTVATVPGLSLQSVNCLNDAPAAALVISAAALIAHRVPFPLLVLAGGMAAGLKPTAAYTLPGLLLLMLLVRKDPPRPAASRWAPGLLALLGLGLGAFWYIRTWIIMGNPIYPVGTPILQDMITQAPLQRVGPSLGSLKSSLVALIDHRIYDNRRPYQTLLEHAAGWGPAAVAVGLPSLLAGLRWNPRLRILAAGFALSLLSVLALVVHDRFCLRFVLWFPALLALALACAVERIPPVRLPALTALLIAALATTFTANWGLNATLYAMRPDLQSRGSGWILQVAPEAPRVGIYGRYPRSYLMHSPDFRRELVYLEPTSPEDLVDQLLKAKVSLIYAIEVLKNTREGQILGACVRRGWIVELAGGAYALPR